MISNNCYISGSLSKEALDRLVYVVGTARGGTSIIRSAIGIHDNILILPGVSYFMNHVWRYRKRVHLRLLSLILRLPEFYREKEVVNSLDETRSRELQKHISNSLASRDLKLMWQIYPLVYSLDKESKKKPEQILCWGDKANDFYRVGAVRRYFPHGKFIFITRDPRGAVSSLAKRMSVKEEFTFDVIIHDEKLIEACIHWRNMAQRMTYFAKRYPGRTMIVRFEDFVIAPEKVLNEIFQFCINIPLPEDVLLKRLSELGYGATNNPEQRGKGISKSPVDRWKKTLNAKQVEIIGELTGETALKLGYEGDEFHLRSNLFEILNRVPSIKSKAIVASKLAYLQMFEYLI